ncbi:MAG: ATP-binding cassette domain-containing protein, partial [Pluralibacter gergoviae]|nr:ATP-binding cassette domain-containing protein [Pluralibacter gergoviae]
MNKYYSTSAPGSFFSRQQAKARVQALDNINLEIYPGEIFVIVGLSGSGKSTLLRTLNHLIPPEEGDVFFEQQSLTSLTPARLIALRRQHIGMVFQSYALYPH